MKKLFIIYPFLFAVFPILFLFAHNAGKVSFPEILLPTAVALGFTALLFLSFMLILKDRQKAGIITLILLALFFFYGHILSLIQGLKIGDILIARSIFLMPLLGILFICMAYFIIRTGKDLHNLTNILNIVALFLVTISLINIGVYELKTIGARKIDNVNIKNNSADLGDPTPARDIYYIILDGYANSSTLKEVFNFDNQELADYLTEKGFYVASKSRANYPSTHPSIASSLNMEYINYSIYEKGEDSLDAIFIRMIEGNKVSRLLQSAGYKIIHMSSEWIPKNNNNYAILSMNCGKFVNEFTDMLIQKTALYPFVDKFVLSGYNGERLCMFSKLANEVQKIEGPKFVFAHILAPHPPYTFGRNGEYVETKSSLSEWNYKSQYLDQLIFINKKTKELINEILSKEKIPPIIILQGDHGPNFSGLEANDKVFQERMPIFNAYYLPDNGKKVLYDSITPVNTFRLIFNYYFNAGYDLLDDKIYYADTSKSFYDFIDVTDKVK